MNQIRSAKRRWTPPRGALLPRSCLCCMYFSFKHFVLRVCLSSVEDENKHRRVKERRWRLCDSRERAGSDINEKQWCAEAAVVTIQQRAFALSRTVIAAGMGLHGNIYKKQYLDDTKRSVLICKGWMWSSIFGAILFPGSKPNWRMLPLLPHHSEVFRRP